MLRSVLFLRNLETRFLVVMEVPTAEEGEEYI
jgi:hypothetical protein